jgi:hypothetical protein
VRWDSLFADLEAAAEAERRREYEAEVAEQARAEFAAVQLVDRLRAHVGQPLSCGLREGIRLEGVLGDVGPQWLLLGNAAGEVLVPVASLLWVEGLGRAVAAPTGEVGRRVGLGVVLRRLAIQRVPVRLALPTGGQVTGTIDRVGADHLDLAVHAPDTPRRPTAVRAVRAVPMSSLICAYLLVT